MVVGSNSSRRSASRDWSKSLASARRDVLVLAILIAAVVLLIWNGSEFFQRLSLCAKRARSGSQDRADRPDAQRRADPVRLAALRRPAARNRAPHGGRGARRAHRLDRRHDRPAQPQGLCRPRRGTCARRRRAGRNWPSFRCSSTASRRSTTATAMTSATRCCGSSRRRSERVAGRRRSGRAPRRRRVRGRPGGARDAASRTPRRWPNELLRAVTRPIEAEGRLRAGRRLLGIAASNPQRGQIPDLLRRADIALDHAKSSARRGRCGSTTAWSAR